MHVSVHAQTGPGGVGNSDGSDGQPPNLLWLRGDAGVTTSGSAVTEWGDQSGNNRDVTQGTATNRPTLTAGEINGVDVVTFDGSDDFLADDPSSYLNGESGVTALVVVESDVDSGSDAGILDTDDTFGDGQDDVFGVRYDASGFESDGTNVIKFGLAAGGTTNQYATEVTDDDVQTTTPQLITYRYENGEGNPLVLLDGSAANASNVNTPSGTVSNMDRLVLGRGAKDGSSSWDGDVAEVILFGTGLNEAERTVVHTYLAEKYGKWNGGSEVLTYNHTGSHFGNFAGIGQAGGTSHTDAQSAQVRIQNPSSLTNGDFLLFGHDETPFGLTTSERPRGDGNVQKTEREWRVDLKGSSSSLTVDVEVDRSSLSLPGGFNDVGLFVDTDGDGDFTTGDPAFYPLDGTDTATGVTLSDGDHVTVAAINRTVQFASATASAFENAGGNNLGDAAAPALNVELNYASASDLSIPFEVTEVTGTLVEDETTEPGRNHPDYRRVAPGTFTISAGTTGPLNFNTAATIDGETTPAFEVVNDGRDAQTDGDESSPEELDIVLTGTFPAGVSAGATSTLTYAINDDDDPRKISFAGAGGKPVKLLGTNPEEDADPNGKNQSGEENAVETVSFEVALPEGIEGSPTTYATFEVTGGETDDFSIPDNSTQNRLGNRRGEVQVNNTQTVNGQSTGYGTFDLTIENDDVLENDEPLTVTLTKARSGTLDPDGSADLDVDYTILNDDQAMVSVATSSDAGGEGTSSVQATLTLNSAAETDLDVDVSLGGTATGGGTDYTQGTSSPVTFSAGVTTRDVDVTVVDDNAQEADETIEVAIEDNATTDPAVASPSTFTYTITDNDRLAGTGPGGVGSKDSNLLWVRADAIDGVSDGAALSAWADQSGNNHDLTAATAPTYDDENSTNAINGRPVVTFGGNGQFLEDDGNGNYLDGLDAVSIFSVVQSAATGTDAGYFDTEGSANGRDELLAVRYDDAGANSGRDDVIKIGINDEAQQLETSETIDGVDVQQTAPQIHQVRWASGTDLTFALNGTADGSPDRSGSTVTDLLQANTVELGRGPKANGDANGWDGQVAEVFAFNTALNGTQRTLVQNYLSAKYDVTLTGGTADQYAGDDNGNGDYDDGVFGVGREGSTDFHPAAETDGLRFEAQAGDLNDGDYLMAGYAESDNGVNTGDVSGVSGLEARMERDWYWDVTNSGSGPTVDVIFDLSEAGLASVLDPGAGEYVLLYRSGQSGSWTEVSGSASVGNGDEITFSGIDASSQGPGYYTIGTTDRTISPLSGTAITLKGTAGNEGDATSGQLGGDAGWRLIGPPVTGAAAGDLISGSDTDGSVIEFSLTQGNMFFEWDDTGSGPPPGDWTAVTSSGAGFENGRGYLLFLFDDEGTPDADPIDPELVLDVGTGSVRGTESNVDVTGLNRDAQFHVLANPFNVPFDLTRLEDGNGGLNTTGAFNNTVQIWDGGATTAEDKAEAGSFVDVDVNGTVESGVGNMATTGDIVSAWQGFVVERTTTGSGDTQLTFNANGTTDGPRGIVGGKSKTSFPGVRMELRLVVENDEGRQIARDEAATIAFEDGATVGWDAFDASKLTPLASRYAVVGPVGPVRGDSTDMKAVESRPLPAGDAPIEVPLALHTDGDVSGAATLQADAWTGVPESWTVTLVDTKGTSTSDDDETHTLTPESDYSFTLTASQEKANNRGAASPTAASREGRVPLSVRSRNLRLNRGPSAPSTTAKAASSPRFTLRIETNDAPLPVELADFRATTTEKQVALSWSTAGETNNAGFAVQHQALAPGDSTAASGQWSSLGFVEGAGTTEASTSYRYETDALDYGRHAFRLRQVDADGSVSYSDERKAEVTLDRPYDVTPPFPNPVRRRATLEVAVRESQSVRVHLYDVLGRRVETAFRGEVAGQDTRTIRLNANRLASGTYFLRIQGERFSTTERMVVVQ